MKEHQLVFEKVARTATSSATLPIASCQGIFYVNVSAVASTPSVVFTIAGVSPAGDALYTILESPAITATGLTVLRVSPHLSASTTTAKDILPAAIKVTATHADTDSITYEMRFLGV